MGRMNELSGSGSRREKRGRLSRQQQQSDLNSRLKWGQPSEMGTGSLVILYDQEAASNAHTRWTVSRTGWRCNIDYRMTCLTTVSHSCFQLLQFLSTRSMPALLLENVYIKSEGECSSGFFSSNPSPGSFCFFFRILTGLQPMSIISRSPVPFSQSSSRTPHVCCQPLLRLGLLLRETHRGNRRVGTANARNETKELPTRMMGRCVSQSIFSSHFPLSCSLRVTFATRKDQKTIATVSHLVSPPRSNDTLL